MKKMMKYAMTLTVALMAAGAVQAAAINWSAPVAMLDSEGAILNGATVLLIQVANGGTAPVLGWDSGLTISGGNYLGKTTLAATGKLSPTAVVSITGTWTTGDINVYGGGAFGEPATVKTAGFGNTKGLDYYMVVFDSATITVDSTYATSKLLNKYSANDTGNLTLAFSTPTGAASTWEPVPEPTSLALVGLGVVALALRRRFVK